MQGIFRITTHWILRFLEFQLFITLASLPILINWGLPISILSPLGNIIFMPFIMLFLLISSLIFFTELLYIPNNFLISSLEFIYNIWMNIMSYVPFNPLIGFPQPNPLFFIILPIATLAIFTLPFFKKKYYRLLFAVLLFGTTIGFVKYIQHPSQELSSIICNKGKVTIINKNNKVAVIDPGYIGRNKSAASWLAYTLMPHIVKTTGHTTINYFILERPTKTTILALTDFVCEHRIDTIYMPHIEGKNIWEVKKLKEMCYRKKCSLIQITKSVTINIDIIKLIIKPEKKITKKGHISYHANPVRIKIT